MKYILMPSLEHIALVKIVVMMWNQQDVRNFLTELSVSVNSIEFDTEWENTIESTVMEKVPLLPLPGILKEKVADIIKPVGKEIKEWMKYHSTHNYGHVDLPYVFHFTPQGTLDLKKTAYMLVKDEKLDICKRYELACSYCLEDDILELWNKIPESLKKCFSFGNSLATSQQFILNHWSNIMQGSDNASFTYKDAFKFCAEVGEKEATKYFLQKLTPEEREECLVTIVKDVTKTDVLYILLTQMDEKQQIEVFKNEYPIVLLCFMDWPLQSFFVEVANRMWDFISKEDFRCLLLILILNATRDCRQDCNYKKLFLNFWQESPDDFKSYIIRDGCFWKYLFHFDYKELKLFLQNVSLTEKKKLIYCGHGQLIPKKIIYLISREKWHLLGVFIQECLPSKKEMVIFKNKCERRIVSSNFADHFTKNKHEWDQLFPLSNDLECKKRECVEDGESRPPKKICSEP